MKIIARLFLLFTVVTAVEVYLLLQLAQVSSWWVTVAMIFVPGVVGAWLVKREGARALGAIPAAISGGREPTGAILDGVMVLVAGAFLISPGVLTDVAGIALLVPPVRRRVAAYARRRVRRIIDRKLARGDLQVFGSGGLGGFGAPAGSYEVIDAEDVPRRG